MEKPFPDELIQIIISTNLSLKIKREQLEEIEDDIKKFNNIMEGCDNIKLKANAKEFFSTKCGTAQLKDDIVRLENQLKTLNEATEYLKEKKFIGEGLNSNETPFHEDEQKENVHNNGVDEERDIDERNDDERNDDERNDDDISIDERDIDDRDIDERNDDERNDDEDENGDTATVPQEGNFFLFLTQEGKLFLFLIFSKPNKTNKNPQQMQ